MLSVLWNFMSFVVALSVLITVHELGHFLVARSCGVQIERFSIGFGRAIWRYFDRYGTEFVIALIPLGGYVKMSDKCKCTESSECKICNYVFNNKIISQRAAIIAAGPIANIIFAVLTYWLVFIIGVPSMRPIIGDVVSHSIADCAQITPGMEIKGIDGIQTIDWDAVRMQLITKIDSNQTTFHVISHKNHNILQEKILDLRHWTFKLDQKNPVTSLGIYPFSENQIEPILVQVQTNSAADKAGLRIGDKIIKVEGQPLKQWRTFADLIRNHPGQSLTLDIERNGNILSVILIPDIKSSEKSTEGFAGVIPKVIPVATLTKYRIIHQYGIFNAILEAINKTCQITKLTVQILWKLIIGDVKLNNLSGPVSIAQDAGASAKLGVVYYLMFIALISINLGVINLFPLPIIDGGHLLFLAIEKLRGKPISNKIQNLSYKISFVLLMLLMIFTIFNDFSRL